MAKAPYWIHIADPAYGDAPWPGYRRLGPFLTKDEAVAQAVNDAAVGAGLYDVYDDAGSVAHDAYLRAVAWNAEVAADVAALPDNDENKAARQARHAQLVPVPKAPTAAVSADDVARDASALRAAARQALLDSTEAQAAAYRALPHSVREIMAALDTAAGSHPVGAVAPRPVLGAYPPPGAVQQG